MSTIPLWSERNSKRSEAEDGIQKNQNERGKAMGIIIGEIGVVVGDMGVVVGDMGVVVGD